MCAEKSKVDLEVVTNKAILKPLYITLLLITTFMAVLKQKHLKQKVTQNLTLRPPVNFRPPRTTLV